MIQRPCRLTWYPRAANVNADRTRWLEYPVELSTELFKPVYVLALGDVAVVLLAKERKGRTSYYQVNGIVLKAPAHIRERVAFLNAAIRGAKDLGQSGLNSCWSILPRVSLLADIVLFDFRGWRSSGITSMHSLGYRHSAVEARARSRRVLRLELGQCARAQAVRVEGGGVPRSVADACSALTNGMSKRDCKANGASRDDRTRRAQHIDLRAF